MPQRMLRFFAAPRRRPRRDGLPRADRARAGGAGAARRGASGNAAIATQLYLSPKTVRNHVSTIFAKLQVADRAQAIIRARQAGLGVGPDEAG